MTCSDTYARIAMLKATGTCRPMPSLRQISTSRSAQDTKAPMAHTVMICQIPPSSSGAKRSPYDRSGGAMLICQGFQVGPLPRPRNHCRTGQCGKDGCDSEESNVERADPEIEQVSPDEGSTAHAVLTFKTQHGHSASSDLCAVKLTQRG